MQRDKPRREIISHLAGLIYTAFKILACDALPVYKANQGHRGQPAEPEYVSSAAAMLLLHAGLDGHLCRIKWFLQPPPGSSRKSARPVPWTYEQKLTKKISAVLNNRDAMLRDQLIEFSTVRGLMEHAKPYTSTYTYPSWKKVKVQLDPSAALRQEVKDQKMKKSECTKLLRLPYVAALFGYKYAVLCVLVVDRFLKILEKKFGQNAVLQPRYTNHQIEKFFAETHGRPQSDRTERNADEWSGAFFLSLSPKDQSWIRRTLGKALP